MSRAVTGHATVGQSGRSSARVGLVSAANFLVATRDSGYRSTALAVAELIDNSIEAFATEVDVEVLQGLDPDFPLEIRVIDNGLGMDAATLGTALSFGGSTRFGRRESLGRYGMGLPNGPISRARRVSVFSWQGGTTHASALDVDDVVRRQRKTLPPVESVVHPDFLPATPSGTAVLLERCDRLEHKRAATVASHLLGELGRIYRRFVGNSITVRVNGDEVAPVDPLFLMPEADVRGGRVFGDTLVYHLDGQAGAGVVEVRFSELPVARWHDRSLAEKRRLGVTSAPTVSVLRAGREIDRGWFFMGSKRRENYDDWWRCEIAFDPALDELFGLTHSKQSIAPTAELTAVLAADLEPIARGLNARVRQRFQVAKAGTSLTDAERRSARAARSLPPLQAPPSELPADVVGLLQDHQVSDPGAVPHRILLGRLSTTAPYDLWMNRGQLILVMNSDHPLYRDVCAPLTGSERPDDKRLGSGLTLAVLAAARVEATIRTPGGRAKAARFRQSWGDVLATFLNAQP
jgi:hypothetical protein